METTEQSVAIFNDIIDCKVLRLTTKRLIVLRENAKANSAKRNKFIPFFYIPIFAFSSVFLDFFETVFLTVIACLFLLAVFTVLERKDAVKYAKEEEMLRTLPVDELLQAGKGDALFNDEIVKVTLKKVFLRYDLKFEKESGFWKFSIPKKQVTEAINALQHVYGEKFISYI